MRTEPTAGTAGPVTVRILGPVQVVGPYGPALLVGARQRAVLGLLALKVGTVVSQSRLVDALWGDDPPRTAVKSLHSHVARVRQALTACGLPDVLVTRDSRYLLAVDAGAVDASRFEDLLRVGQRELAAGAADRAAAQLRAGLALWRDEVALADAEPHGWGAAEVQRLGEVRLAAIVARWDAELRLGRHVEAVGELERLLVAYPTQERLVRLLMLALYRSDRHTGALDAYQRLRVRLADEFGTDPGPELVRLHTRMLRRDPGLDRHPADAAPVVAAVVAPESPAGGAFRVPAPADQPWPAPVDQPWPAPADRSWPAPADRSWPQAPAMPRPAQLPARVGHFTGRSTELSTLDRMVRDPESEVRLAVVSGPAGIGKTALVVQWAHRVADRFADGQLFVDLRGDEPGSGLSPTDALSHLLRSLGVPADRVPGELSEQASLYRSLLHDRRVLVVVDNCATAEAVLPLVPAGSGTMVVVTSRGALTALATHHAVGQLQLDVLTEAESLLLLNRVLGGDAVAGQPEAAAELVRLCDRMPLALRIAAAKLARHPRPDIAALVGELTDADRLDVLTVDGGSRSVRAVFASAYRALSQPAARLFRLLGLHPGQTFHLHLAAAVADLPPAVADRILTELTTAHLAIGVADARYRFHSLVAEFARHCAAVTEPPGARVEATARAVDWYLTVAGAANRMLDPGRDRVTPTPRYPPAELPFRPEHRAALAFLDDERGNLLPVARYALEHGHLQAMWQLTYLLTGFYESRGHRHERVEMCRLGVVAAAGGGDPATAGLMLSGLGVAQVAAHRFEEALDSLYQALPLMRASGDKRGEGHVNNNIAVAYSGLRRFDEALDAFRRALEIHSANGHRLGIALALNNAGHTAVRMGRPEDGAGELATALAISRDIGNPRLEAAVLHSIGEGDLRRGAPEQALAHFHQALAVYRQLVDRRYEAETLNGIGLAQLGNGEPDAALATLRQALGLTRQIEDQHLEAVTLRNLGQAYLRIGEPAAAAERLRQALALRGRIPDPYEEAQLHQDLGALAGRSGDVERAAHHRCLAADLYRKVNANDEADRLAGHPEGGARPAGPVPTATSGRRAGSRPG